MPPPELVRLVERFERNLDEYLRGHYNETQVRQDYIDPLFGLLGWDMGNKEGKTERFRDVILEYSLRVGRHTKAPDYCFQAGRSPIFFVEAKRPSVNLQRDPKAAPQLRLYTWNQKLPVGILTNFRDFVIYDGRFKARPGDKARTARFRTYQYTTYAENWEEIASLLSKDAVQRGSLDRFQRAKRRGTEAVDDAFLKDLERWRGELASNIAKNNQLDVSELNLAVQRIIDRVVFLRICEGRDIETWGSLQALLNGAKTYERLRTLFRRADRFYNSGLFYFQNDPGRSSLPDSVSSRLRIDDAPLKKIIQGLYPPGPYRFSVFPADILGQVYERFLGSVIHLTPKGATVKPKPEVRKARGVYYTPTYIVDYIVRNTVGKLLEKAKTPARAAKLRILDPACGSGSFLLGAYQHLLDWHLEYYSKHDRQRSAKTPRGKGKHPRIFCDHHGEWRLTTSERKRILLANIYGVDIDRQAVEVTRLSLHLELLRGVTLEVLQTELLPRERALPDLGANIRCGNSLIGNDYFDGRLDVTDEERERVNAFDWEVEFPEIFGRKRPGFDAVIGNPPYVSFYSRESLKPDPRVEEHLSERFSEEVGGRLNTFLLFLVQAVRLTSRTGRIAMIVPDTLANNDSYERVRLSLVAAGLESAARLDFPVFEGPTVRTVIPSIGTGRDRLSFGAYPSKDKFVAAEPSSESVVSSHNLLRRQRCKWPFGSLSVERLLEKMLECSVPLQSIAETRDGINPGPREFRVRILNPSGRRRPTWRPVIEGRHVTPFGILPTSDLVDYDPRLLSEALKKKGASFRDPRIFLSPKLVNRQTANTLVFALDDIGYCTLNSVHNTRPLDGKRSTLLYLLGLLNSKLLRFYYRQQSQETRKVFPQVHIAALRQLPIHPPNPDSGEDVATHDYMVSLVRRMLDLHKKLPKAKTPHAKELIDRDIAATDRRIDELVYELYGLTEKEIRIVEEGTGRQ